MALIAFEIFAPGLVLASTGVLCLIASVLVGYQTLGTAAGTALLLGEIIVLVVGGRRWIQWFPKSRFGQKLVLQHTVGVSAEVENKELLQTQTGTVISACRPSGVAEFAKQRYDVISEGAFLPVGQAVKVVAIEGPKIIVRSV